MTVDSNVIDYLIHVDSNDTSKELLVKKAIRNMLTFCMLFPIHQSSSGNPINEFCDWICITEEQFDIYRTNVYFCFVIPYIMALVLDDVQHTVYLRSLMKDFYLFFSYLP